MAGTRDSPVPNGLLLAELDPNAGVGVSAGLDHLEGVCVDLDGVAGYRQATEGFGEQTTDCGRLIGNGVEAEVDQVVNRGSCPIPPCFETTSASWRR
jgi:hypothetical protein